MNINGLNISIDGDTLTIKGLSKSGNSTDQILKLERDGTINRDINGDIYVSCLLDKIVNLTINGNVDGDINCSNITIEGTVNGDVNAGNVTANGSINGDVNAAIINR